MMKSSVISTAMANAMERLMVTDRRNAKSELKLAPFDTVSEVAGDRDAVGEGGDGHLTGKVMILTSDCVRR
jgi:hypothetical protein